MNYNIYICIMITLLEHLPNISSSNLTNSSYVSFSSVYPNRTTLQISLSFSFWIQIMMTIGTIKTPPLVLIVVSSLVPSSSADCLLEDACILINSTLLLITPCCPSSATAQYEIYIIGQKDLTSRSTWVPLTELSVISNGLHRQVEFVYLSFTQMGLLGSAVASSGK